jgi:hypothetical protein
VTPSSAQALNECQLRLAYASDADFSHHVPSTQAARLGTACHEVLQIAGEGGLPNPADPGWRSAFEETWQKAVDKQAADAAASPLEARWGDPQRWRYYNMRKIATRHLAERLSASIIDDPEGSAAALHEAPQEAFGGKLRGRADVIRRGAEPEIQDFKTGAVIDGQDGDIKPSYRIQMLLYAVLERENNGVWPLRATLIPLEGQPVSIDIDPNEANRVAEACLGALDDYNATVRDGRPVAGLAAPSVRSCRFCPYAVRCPAFWDAIDLTWAEDGVRAIAGRVLAREIAELGTLALKVEITNGVASGEVWLYGLDPERFPASATTTPGEWVAATSLIGARDYSRFRPSEQTRLVVSNASH